MAEDTFDVIVIGGGPGGSATGTLLAKAGRRVLVLEKEVFPRFHIGESLLPYNHSIFREMGVLEELENAGLVKKHGAQFHLSNGTEKILLCFRNGRFTKEKLAYQVERATFDHILLKHTRKSGADVREGWTVNKFQNEGSSISVEATGPDGKKQTFRAAYLIDASGRGNLTGNQENLREYHPNLKKLSVFGHFTGVKLDEGEKGGDTIIIRLNDAWFWIIPVTAEKTSVGLVMDKTEFAKVKETPAELFAKVWQSSPVLRERMKDAKLVGEIHTTSDFSYKNKRLVGPRLIRVGDAAGFLDPIFSSGVFLAMRSGKQAADLINAVLDGANNEEELLRNYEAEVRRSMMVYWKIVEGFYTTPFMELFVQPRNKFELVPAITALLAGELDGGWALRWRMEIFFLLVKLQQRWPLVPRVKFE